MNRLRLGCAYVLPARQVYSSHHNSHRYRLRPILLDMVGAGGEFLTEDVAQQQADAFHTHEPTGRPLGDDGFITGFERLVGRDIHKKKPSRKRKRTRNRWGVSLIPSALHVHSVLAWETARVARSAN